MQTELEQRNFVMQLRITMVTKSAKMGNEAVACLEENHRRSRHLAQEYMFPPPELCLQRKCGDKTACRYGGPDSNGWSAAAVSSLPAM